MAERVRRILVVGGGTAGWLSACFLNRSLASADPRERIEVALVESKDIGIIGVGEATLANIKRMMLACEIDEREFMRSCDASFKNAIKFVGFRRQDEVFWHPFTQLTHVNRFSIANLWLEEHRRGYPLDYARMVAPDPEMCDAGRAPKNAEHGPYEGLVNYAYHIDTVKLGRYLRQVAIGRGVEHIVDTVTEVRRHENGDVSHVVTAEHGDIAADFFIDCTGFRGLLINQTLGEPFIGYTDVLFNNAAVAMRVPYRDAQATIDPHTTCHAQDAGWIWEIPLHRRRGMGHVYCDGYIDKDRAEQRLRDFIGAPAEGLEANHIRMRIGRTRRAWVNNVCAIGLSGGFIEPLESTGIYLAELGLDLLYGHFPDKQSMAAMAARYNHHMQSYYEEIRDFICMHYCLSERDDSAYWRDCAAHPALPDSLRDKLDLWAHRLPIESDINYSTQFPAFSAVSYVYICLGMGHWPRHGLAAAAFHDSGFAQAVFQDRWRNTEQTLAQAPDHRAALESIHAGTA